jgi:ABC-type multidrug transport system ATPase subunit
MVAVMDRGRIVAQGTPAQLKARLGGEVVRVHLMDGAVITRPAPRGAADLMDVVRELDRTGVAVADIALTRPTLDDVFLSLTS